MTFKELSKKIIKSFQKHVTDMRIHIYDGISRFSGIAYSLLYHRGDPNFDESCLLSKTITLEVRYRKQEFAGYSVANILELMSKVSFATIKHNKNVAENTFLDKINTIMNTHVPSIAGLRDVKDKRDFHLMFSEASLSSEEIGTIFHGTFDEEWKKIELLFLDKCSDNASYVTAKEDIKAILREEKSSERLLRFIINRDAGALKEVLVNELRRTMQRSRSPYKDLNLYSSLKIVFMMIILEKLPQFHLLVGDIERASKIYASDDDESDSESVDYVTQWVPNVVPNQSIDPTSVDERMMSKFTFHFFHFNLFAKHMKIFF